MPLKFYDGVPVARLEGPLHEEAGAQLAEQVRREVPQGGKLVIDGSALTGLNAAGVAQLMAVQRWTATPERHRLLVAGFGPDLWRTILECRGEFVFEARPTLAEALLVYGVAPAKGRERLEETDTRVRPPFDEVRTRVHTKSAAQTTRTPLEPEPPTLAEFTPPARPAKPRPWLLIGSVLALFLAGLGLWRALDQGPPELSLSTNQITVEEGGREIEGVTVKVKHGKLVEPAGLPRQLAFTTPSEEDTSRIYTLQGAAAEGAQSVAVPLVAESADGRRRSASVMLAVTVQPKPLEWQLTSLQSLPLRAGQPIQAHSKFLAGAPQPPTSRGLPPGLEITPVPGAARDWQLAGTPTQAGSFPVTFAAETGSRREGRTCTLEVLAALPAPAPVAQEDAPPKPADTVDDGLRKFLLERIERLPARYTPEDRENLRLVVRRLQQAKLLARIAFEEEGQTSVSPPEAARLATALQTAEAVRLLGAWECRVVVVGYASLTGSLAANVRISKLRAKAVGALVRRSLGRNADLCGDYGPTDVVDAGLRQNNRVVEVYAGTMELPEDLRRPAERFVDDFNRRHGAH